MGRELSRRARIWNDPHLYIWGWQSPLHFYGRMDSPTRHFFVDNLLRDQADRDHRLIRPRTEEIMATLERRPPELIFTGYPPFRALRAFLNDRYLPSDGAGLWVRQEDYRRFENGRACDRSGTTSDQAARLKRVAEAGLSAFDGRIASPVRCTRMPHAQPPAHRSIVHDLRDGPARVLGRVLRSRRELM